MAQTRKTPQSWIDAGLSALVELGPSGLRAETLARRIGTTKGSFYWHFADVPAFHDAVLAHWSDDLLLRFSSVLGKADTDVTRLRAVSGFRPSRLDHAVRAWAVQDANAARVLGRVDAKLHDLIAQLLKALGATHPDFPGLIHAAIFASPEGGAHVETLIDLLLVLK